MKTIFITRGEYRSVLQHGNYIIYSIAFSSVGNVEIVPLKGFCSYSIQLSFGKSSNAFLHNAVVIEQL
ncbi:MAG: hypothetical protein WBB36_08965, partial [Chitinophagales bacterium]